MKVFKNRFLLLYFEIFSPYFSRLCWAFHSHGFFIGIEKVDKLGEKSF